jgi:hypothetical protein
MSDVAQKWLPRLARRPREKGASKISPLTKSQFRFRRDLFVKSNTKLMGMGAGSPAWLWVPSWTWGRFGMHLLGKSPSPVGFALDVRCTGMKCILILLPH